MLLQINQLFLLNLQKLSGSTGLIIAIIQICLLPSIMRLGKFLQDAAQFNIYRHLEVKEQTFHYCFALESQNFKSTDQGSNEMMRVRVAKENWFFHKV